MIYLLVPYNYIIYLFILSGHDAPMIAYDALLGGKGNWEQVSLRGILHGGGDYQQRIMN